MTKDEALNIAIDYMNERLEEHDAKFQRHPATEAERNNILADIETVKEALAQPEQEPVADHFDCGTYLGSHIGKEIKHRIENYSPPQRTWVGLTPQERDEINEQVYGAVPHHVAFHAAIEAKLKEKNT